MPVTMNTPPPAKKPTASQVKAGKKTLERKEAIEGIFGLGIAGLTLAKQYADAEAISQHGEKIATELAVLADQNEAVGQLIDRLTEVGPYAGIIAAVSPLILQILVNHDKAKPGVMGTVSPKLLEAKARAQIETAEAALQLEIDEQTRQVEKLNAMREKANEPDNL